jgi:hypothetical protein
MVGQKPVALEYLKVLRAKDVSTLQGKERDCMACRLQAMDCVIHVKLSGLRFTKTNVAFLIDVGYIQSRSEGHCTISLIKNGWQKAAQAAVRNSDER